MLVSLFGRPGAGKSTLGDALAARHGFRHLALGTMLKDPATLREIGIDPVEMEEAVASGRTITSPKLYPWLDELIRSTPAVVVDGYPRATVSAEPFGELVRSLPEDREVFAVLLHCSSGITHPRLHARRRVDDDRRIACRDEEYELIQRPLIDSLPASVRRVDVDASCEARVVLSEVEVALRLTRQGARD